MRSQLLLAFMSVALFSNAADYYWVGGTGNWSDLAHWSTSSGGTADHTQLPGMADDVYLDANSFTAPGQVLTLDLSMAMCRNFNAMEATNSPMVQGVVYTDELQVYGDFLMPAGVNRYLSIVRFMGEGTHTLHGGGVPSGSLSFFNFSSSGTYNLDGPLSVGNVYLYNEGGTFNSNGQTITATSRIQSWSTYNNTIDLTGSELNTRIWAMYESNDLILDNVVLNLTSVILADFTPGPFFYPHVNVVSKTKILANLNCGTFECQPGSEVSLNPGIVVNADQFILIGSALGSIDIYSSEPGTPAEFVQTSGTVSAEYLVIQDNHASGGALFQASNSIDNGGNLGWNFLVDEAENYYWVGGTGEWTDASHWATTSGGAELQGDAPGLNDTAVFDANSFSSAAEYVTITGNPTVGWVDASDAQAGAEVRTSPGFDNSLTVLNDFFGGSVRWELYKLDMATSGTSVLDGGDLSAAEVYKSADGTLEVQNLSVINNIWLYSGELRMIGLELEIPGSISVMGTSNLNIENSTIDLSSYIVNAPDLILQASGSSITCHISFAPGSGHTFHSLVLDGEVYCGGQNNYSVLTITPGSIITFNVGAMLTLGSLDAIGTEAEPIELVSATPGNVFEFIKSDGLVEANYLTLSDNTASGGATFNCYDCTDNGNVTGWNFLDPDFVSEFNPLEQVMIWPNPTSGNLYLSELPGNCKFELLSMDGRSIWNFQEPMVGQLSLPNLPAGTYFLEIKHPDFPRVVKRLVLSN